ncbi:MAG TPA: hypothetical protein VHK91_06325, partial [Flavisolibacter sp.]|nr:hypothetical protein [Flavisolibacter sp.]
MMRFVVLSFLFCTLFSCKDKADKPDVSDVTIKLKTERFEPALFQLDTMNLPGGLQQLNQRYPKFYGFFMEQLLHIPSAYSESTVLPLKQLLRSYRPIYDSIEIKYKDFSGITEALEDGFRYVKHYYPGYKVPDIITYIATFDAPGIVLTKDYLGIGLHQFAGKNFSIYKDPQLQELYPSYLSRRFDKEYIPANSFKAIVDDLYPDSSTGRPLIEQMIEKGKQWYLLDHFLPDAPDSLKTGYTKKQLDWCQSNEGNIWSFLSKNTDIYTIDPESIQDYIGEGPFTRGMPEESSPGNLGQWIGWQIVKSFSSKNAKLTVQ